MSNTPDQSSTPDLSSTPDEADALGAEIPALGGSDGRPVNKKLIIVLVVAFILIAIAIAFVMSKITNRNAVKVAAPVVPQTIAFPAQRDRLAPAPAPAQPMSQKPQQPMQGGAGPVPNEAKPGAIPLASEKGLGTEQAKAPLPGQGSFAPPTGKPQISSLADKRSTLGGGLMMGGGEVGGTGVNSSEATQNDMAWKKRLLPTEYTGGARGADSNKPAAGPAGAAAGMASALTSVMVGGRGGAGANNGEQPDTAVPNNQNKSSNAIEAQRLATDRNYLFPRGSNITCVLDSRIVSDLSGQTSCTVNRNVYSMNGTYRLIPKGSRLSGTYGGGAGENDRLSVIWDRIVTPEGIEVSIAESGSDAMGSPGIPGEVDEHWVKKLSTAILVSLAGDLFKLGSIKYGPAQETTRLEPLGGKTTEIKPYESIVVDLLSKIPAQIAAKTLAAPGTITIQQGQMINIMTTRDIDFQRVKASL